jgi:hypothetical protein
MRDLHTPISQLLHNSNLFYSWWYSGIPILDSSLDSIDLYNKIIEYIMIKYPEMKEGLEIINNIDLSSGTELKVYTYTNDDYKPKIQIFNDLRLAFQSDWIYHHPPTYVYSLIYNTHQVNSFNINGWSFTDYTKKKHITKHFYYIMNNVLDYAISHPLTFDLSKVNINYICNFVQSLSVRDEIPLFTGQSRDLTVKNMKTLFDSHTFTGKTDFMNGQLYQDILLEQFEKLKDEYVINNYSACDKFIQNNLIH